MSGILNNLYAKGYQDDMIDWYRITVLLEVLTTTDDLPRRLKSPVTSFYDFEQLYAWANQSNIRSIALKPVSDGEDMLLVLGKGRSKDQYTIA